MSSKFLPVAQLRLRNDRNFGCGLGSRGYMLMIPPSCSIVILVCFLMKVTLWGECQQKNVWLFFYSMTTPDWAAIPLGAGTRKVIRDGMMVPFERGDVLSRHANG